MRKTAVNITASSKGHMPLAYADDVDIIERTIREVTLVISKIQKESAKKSSGE